MTSWQSKALIAKYRLTRKKRIFADAQKLRRSAESHQSESAQFPDWLRAKYDVTMQDVRGHRCYTLRPHAPRSTKHCLLPARRSLCAPDRGTALAFRE